MQSNYKQKQVTVSPPQKKKYKLKQKMQVKDLIKPKHALGGCLGNKQICFCYIVTIPSHCVRPCATCAKLSHFW